MTSARVATTSSPTSPLPTFNKIATTTKKITSAHAIESSAAATSTFTRVTREPHADNRRTGLHRSPSHHRPRHARHLPGKESGYAFGLGFQLGMGIDSSFIYEAHVSPLGWGLALGHSGYVMLLGGVGVDGATSRIPISAILPVQALVAFDVQRRVRLGFDGTLTWVTNSDRENGVRILGTGDEFDLGASIRIGKSLAMDQFNMGRGYYFLRIDQQRPTPAPRSTVFGDRPADRRDLAENKPY